MESLRQKIAEAKTKAYSLKTKAAQKKAWTKVRELKHELFMELCKIRDTYATHSFKGVADSVLYRDDVGFKTPHGYLWICPTADDVSKSWYASTCCVTYAKGQDVIIEADVDIDHERLVLILVPKRIIGGTLDVAKYAELDKRTDLAFFKHSNSDGVTGLFSTKGA